MSLLVLSSSLRLLTRRAALTSALLSSPSLGAATARLPTPRRSAASKSSQAYIARQRTDHFVVARGSFRSRAAFKLQDLAAKYKLLKPSVQTVVDLGAAPGGWSQVLTQGKGSNTRAVVAVDLLDMEKIPGVHFVKGDFLDPRTRLRIRDYLIAEGGKNGHNKADLVLSDMAANVSGSMEKDAEAALQIAESCYEFCKTGLRVGHTFANGDRRSGGTLVMKLFTYPELATFKRTFLDRSFEDVFVSKPEASRKESSEIYWVCKGFKGDVVGELIAPPAPEEQQQWADT